MEENLRAARRALREYYAVKDFKRICAPVDECMELVMKRRDILKQLKSERDTGQGAQDAEELRLYMQALDSFSEAVGQLEPLVKRGTGDIRRAVRRRNRTRQWLLALTPLERELLYDRHARQLSWDRLSLKYNYSEGRLRNIERDALEKLIAPPAARAD